MRRQKIHTILLFILLFESKVIVIDDVGATKAFGPDKKELVEEVRKKINSENEEVVIYGKNKRNRNIRISSNEYDQNAIRKREEELKEKTIKMNNQKIINSLRKLINEESKTPKRRLKPRKTQFNNHQTAKPTYSETANNNPKNEDKKENKIEIDEPVIEKLSMDEDQDLSYKPPPSKKSILDFDSINDFSSLFKPKNDASSLFKPKNDDSSLFKPKNDASFLFKPKNGTFDDFLPYKSQLSPITKNNYLPTKNKNPFNFTNKEPNLYDTNEYEKDLPAYDPLMPESSISKDNISLLKNQEKENLLRAINNRKEYLRIKIDEVHNKKENIANQLGDYKRKIEEIYNRINTTRNIRDKLYTKMNMERSHIGNLKQNSKEIQEKEGKLKDMISMTRNQIVKYKSLLENEMAKLDVLEKQYEVYENTLKRYNDDSNQESNHLIKLKNDLAKHENDLKDLNEIFSLYKCKHNDLNDELNRQSKIESDLEIENNKIGRNELTDMI